MSLRVGKVPGSKWKLVDWYVADRDSDPASITILTQGPAQHDSEHLADGAVVILKGGPTVALFCQWAERNKMLTCGKPIVADPPKPSTEDDEEEFFDPNADHGAECDCDYARRRHKPAVLACVPARHRQEDRRGRAALLAITARPVLPSAFSYCVSTPKDLVLAHEGTFPCQRFAPALAGSDA